MQKNHNSGYFWQLPCFLLVFLAVFLNVSSIFAAEDYSKDFSVVRQGLEDGSFVPIAFQRPCSLISKDEKHFLVENIRWEVQPVKKCSWYAVPHKYSTVKIDLSKARHAIIGRQTVSPIFIHSFLVVSFDKGGLVVDGQSSQGLVLTIEPLLRNDQHSLKVPIDMAKGKYPKIYQLTSWENFTVFCGEIMQQMAWLRPLRSDDPLIAAKLAESMIEFAVKAPATEPFDYVNNNCGAGLYPIISKALPDNEEKRLADVLKASSKPNFSRWFQKHLEAASLLDETKSARMYRNNFFIPLEDLCKGFYKPQQVKLK
ncbi:MAG: hypothetical protein HQM10_16495 [Candidatus Riflebacteria bacterium]|nr:hypothetical protein [Candidatus Riflebacteria bacterium]